MNIKIEVEIKNVDNFDFERQEDFRTDFSETVESLFLNQGIEYDHKDLTFEFYYNTEDTTD